MNDLPLFAASSLEEDATWSVTRLNEAISHALSERFPQEIWVRGEIQGLARTRMRKHWYFELVEKDEYGDGVKGKLSVALLSWNRGPVDRTITSSPGFRLDDDIEVRIKGRVDFYPPFGKLQFVMTGVDPAFTLGQLALRRERILRALKAEGVLRANAERPMPLVPARIGLITSVGSAAYNDFINELEQGGFGHRVVVADARVQGAEAERTLLAALGTLKACELDLIAIVRGGGSQSDLAAFDSEALARAICKMPIPVLTGIGHEIDTSVADHVAHTAYKTPTACAAALVASTANFLSLLQEKAEEIASLAGRRTANERHRLILAAQLASSRAKARVISAQRDLAEAERSLLRETPRALARAEARRERIAGELRGAGRLVLHRADQSLKTALRELTLSRMRVLLNRQAEKLSAQETRVRLLDPRRVLARGYSISRGPTGAVVRSAAELKRGDMMTTQLSRGSVKSEVKECRKEKKSP